MEASREASEVAAVQEALQAKGTQFRSNAGYLLQLWLGSERASQLSTFTTWRLHAKSFLVCIQSLSAEPQLQSPYLSSNSICCNNSMRAFWRYKQGCSILQRKVLELAAQEQHSLQIFATIRGRLAQHGSYPPRRCCPSCRPIAGKWLLLRTTTSAAWPGALWLYGERRYK